MLLGVPLLLLLIGLMLKPLQRAVVEDGRIAEFGSHDVLVAQEGSCAALWSSWQS